MFDFSNHSAKLRYYDDSFNGFAIEELVVLKAKMYL